jgi:hypothetical protein
MLNCCLYSKPDKYRIVKLPINNKKAQFQLVLKEFGFYSHDDIFDVGVSLCVCSRTLVLLLDFREV